MVNLLLKTTKLFHRYVILRHGQSQANIAKIISSDPSISVTQHGLSNLGVEQATKAGISLCTRPFYNQNERVAIFSSDFKRAHETARLVGHQMKKANISLYSRRDEDNEEGVVLETRLRERSFGDLNGLSDDNYKKVWEKDASDPNHTEFNVESVNNVVHRTTALITDIEHELPKGESDKWLCVLVAHGDVLQILQTAFQKIDGSHHRSLPHLDTATPREVKLSD